MTKDEIQERTTQALAEYRQAFSALGDNAEVLREDSLVLLGLLIHSINFVTDEIGRDIEIRDGAESFDDLVVKIQWITHRLTHMLDEVQRSVIVARRFGEPYHRGRRALEGL